MCRCLCLQQRSLLVFPLNSPEDRTEHGQEYVYADNGRIFNEGEKKVPSISNEGEKLGIERQVAQVSRPRSSGSKLSDAGYETNLGDKGGTIRNRRKGRITKVHKRHEIYVLDLWVPNTEAVLKEGFARPRSVSSAVVVGMMITVGLISVTRLQVATALHVLPLLLLGGLKQVMLSNIQVIVLLPLLSV